MNPINSIRRQPPAVEPRRQDDNLDHCRRQLRRGRVVRRRSRRGLSILETMLAIAVLGGTLAALGELVRTGSRAARMSQDLTLGQLLCENKINEVVLGVELMAAAQGVFPNYPEWSYSVATQPVDQQGGLIGVVVTVMHNDESDYPFTYQLMRWTIDPMMKYPPPELEEEENEIAPEIAE